MKRKAFRRMCTVAAAGILVGHLVLAQTAPASPPAAGEGGGDNGTDPSAFARRVLLYNDFNRLRSGVKLNATYLDLVYPMLPDARKIERAMLKVEMQFDYGQNLGPLAPPRSG